VSDLKHKKLEKYLQQHVGLNFTRVADEKMDKVDRTRPIVTFVEFFYELSDGTFPEEQDGYSTPPTQATFATLYYQHNKNEGANRFTTEYKDCWTRRAEVSYPSLVRDMHFTYLLQDLDKTLDLFDSVEYDPIKDIKHGADSIIEHDGETYYVNLYVDTNKSQTFLEEKKDHRHPEHDHTEIHLPIQRNDERNKELELADGSDIWLYSMEHVAEILELVLDTNEDDAMLLTRFHQLMNSEFATKKEMLSIDN